MDPLGRGAGRRLARDVGRDRLDLGDRHRAPWRSAVGEPRSFASQCQDQCRPSRPSVTPPSPRRVPSFWSDGHRGLKMTPGVGPILLRPFRTTTVRNQAPGDDVQVPMCSRQPCPRCHTSHVTRHISRVTRHTHEQSPEDTRTARGMRIQERMGDSKLYLQTCEVKNDTVGSQGGQVHVLRVHRPW